jgi:hypothetical protein
VTTTWVNIRYRDFYDIPRAIVVEWHNHLYLFDCLYNHDVDDYDPDYSVYELPDEFRDKLDVGMSWTDLGHRGTRIGSVATASVEFDSTKRRVLNAAIFTQLGL